MLGALVAGERDPVVMAEFARNRMRRKIPDPTEALTARFDECHAMLVGQLLRRLEHGEASLRVLDAEFTARMAPWDDQLELLRDSRDRRRDRTGVHRRDRSGHDAVRLG